MHFEHKFCKLRTCLLLSSIIGYFCDSHEKMYILNVCTHNLKKKKNSLNNSSQLEKCMFDSIPFSLGDNGSSSVPGKVNKAASTTTKRSIADSEEKSEAYKSIFTSHSSAKRSKEECSNWVTHTAYCF